MTAKAEGHTWTITLGDAIAEPTAPLNLTRAADGLGRSRVLVPHEGFGDIHWLTDPEVGDSLAIITRAGPRTDSLPLSALSSSSHSAPHTD